MGRIGALADYNSLIDAEVWAFIHKTDETYPDDTIGLSIADQRRIYDAMCRAFYQGRPEAVTATERLADGVPVRIYTAGLPDRTVMYFHGGGYVVGDLNSHDDCCAEICAQTGYRVVSVDYRLSPEHKHPAAFDDAWCASLWATREFNDPVVLTGDSAGGNLAAAVAHHARGRLLSVLGQVLIYPGLGGDVNTGSYIEHAKAPMLTRNDVLFFQEARLDGPAPQSDPTYAPLQDIDFTGLPPTVVFTADCDPLRDDGRVYCQQLTQANVPAHWINEAGLVHGYLRARTSVARAGASFERISVAIEALGQGVWPYG